MISTYRRYTTEFKKYANGVMECVKAPDFLLEQNKKLKGARRKYRAIDKDGLARIGEKVMLAEIILCFL